LVSAKVVTPEDETTRAASAPTVVQMPAVARTAATVPPSPAKAPEKAPEKAAKPKKAFSETAWFMQKIEPDMIDPRTGRVVADTSKAPAEEVDAETRKRYSLRTDEDEE